MKTYPFLHNAAWPGCVGKQSQGGSEEDISLEEMVELTADASVDGETFDGIDYFLFTPHTDPDASDDELHCIADMIAGHGLAVGTVVAPVWPGTVGGSAMGGPQDRANFVLAVEKACRIAKVFKEHGVRRYGCIRIDTAAGHDNGASIARFSQDPEVHRATIAATIRQAAQIAADHGERLAIEGEICWAGVHSWQEAVKLLQAIDLPDVVGFQADLAHTYLFLLGYNAPGAALLQDGYSQAEFAAAYKQMTDALRDWTVDFHVAQNDGTVQGSGDHDKTGRHCQPDDPNGKLDIVEASRYWLIDAQNRGLRHICWDGCMFPNAVMRDPQTWNTILKTMIDVREAHGWN